MHRIDTPTATGDGRFTEGDPLVPIPATVVSADWLNSVQEELVSTLLAAGIAPDKTNNAQLLAAIRQLVGTINTPYEALRKNLIGVPRYWRSTTLPANHVWANGDFVLFSDWPELKKVYDGGGFNGMLLAYNADNATIAANLGKWRPNAANPTGLYVPKLSEQFFRAWTGAGSAGGCVADMGRNLTAGWTTGWLTHFAPTVLTSGAAFTTNELAFEASNGPGQKMNQPFHVSIDAGRVWGAEHAGAEFAPTHVRLPIILYLGEKS